MQTDISVIRNRYRLEAELGKGGMGVVYRAFDRLTGKTLALKRISPSAIGDIETEDTESLSEQVALAKEFRVLASLHHPYIIRVQDYGFDEQGHAFFTMELVEDAVEFYTAAARVDTRTRVKLLIQILQALAYLHRHDIIHRDLKPSNVLVTRDNTIHLLDFGLATKVTQTHELVIGTLRYIAPEALLARPLSAATDFFAFGIMAYEVLVGKHPFVGAKDNYQQMINKILTGEADLESVPQQLPIAGSTGSLRAILGRLLAHHPRDRYARAEAVIADLSALIAEPPPRETQEIRRGFLNASPFIGRAEELERLQQLLGEAKAGRGNAILIGGESGIGKSRLVDELRIHALVNGALVLQGQAVAGGGLFYQLWRSPLRRLVLHVPITDEEMGILSALIPDIESLLQRPLKSAVALGGADTQRRLHNTIISLFKRISQPTVLIVEDLQQTYESLELLKAILPLTRSLPLLIIGTYRDDEAADLPQQLEMMELMTLRRLSKAHITALSEAMLGEAGKQEQVVDLLYRETEGNVFFIIEVVRALAEGAGSLSDIGIVTLPQHITAGGIQQVVESRLRRVPEAFTPFLRLAAIAGRQIDPNIMKRQIAKMTAERQAAAAAIGRAEAAPEEIFDQLILACSHAAIFSVQEDTWSFTHDKLREAVLERIPEAERPQLYRQLAETIEQVYSDDLEAWSPMLAQYWAEAGDLRKEAHYTYITAERTAEVGVLSMARWLFQRLLQIRAYEFHEQPQLQQGIILHHLSNIFQRMGQFEQAIAHEKEAIALFQQVGAQEWICRAYGAMGDIYLRYEQLDSAHKYFEKNLELARQGDNREDLGLALMNFGNYAQLVNKLEDSLRYRQESYEILREVSSPIVLSKAINNLAIAYDMLGDYERAIALYEECLDIRRRHNDRQGLVNTLHNLAAVYMTLEQHEKARKLSLEMYSLAQELNAHFALCYCLIMLYSIEYQQGEYAAARRYSEELMALAERYSFPAAIYNAYTTRGQLALREQEYAIARDSYQKALAVATEIDHNSQMRLCIYHLAGIKLHEGEAEQALQLLAAVKDAFDSFLPPNHTETYWQQALEAVAEGAETIIERGQAMKLEEVAALLLAES